MNVRRWWNSLTFSNQIFVFMALMVVFTVLSVEMIFEPIVEGNFDLTGGDIDWHEVPVWAICAGVLGLLCAAFITRMTMRRLDRLAAVTGKIAHGDLSARLPEGGNPADVFTTLSRRFNMMADTIEQLLVNERRLLSDISHELRSPLARISAAVELMSLKNGDNENTALLHRVEGEIGHMSHLIGVLLEQGRNSLSVREGRAAIALSELAEDLAEGFRMQGETQRKTLSVSIAPGMIVDGHAMQLRLIMENLLGNALFYAPPDSGIEFTLSPEGSSVRIEVRDYGPGVPEQHLKNIFRAFYRVDSSRARRSGGVGLGLTLVKEAATALGGDVHAGNADPGLRVTVLLPRSEI